jgi:hypothetical protein
LYEEPFVIFWVELTFGINLILMLDYRLSFDIDVKNGEGMEILIISRKDVPAWKKNNNSNIKAYL